ncbi:MAG: septum site-determining protein MinC [Methylotetracoccus sp.]
MSLKANDHPASAALEIKSGSVNVLNIRLLDGDPEAIIAQIEGKLATAPEFFRNAPVALDFSVVEERNCAPQLASLLPRIRALGLNPVGVRGAGEELQRAAEQAGIGVLPDIRVESPVPAKDGAKSNAESGVPKSANRLIDTPVRSGQRIYAAGGDLIVLAPVSAGAELMADGNIHIYSSLRGRALAGVQGNLESRIFCLDLQAELIAIGGRYQISENLEESIRGRPVQVFLREDALIIEDL